MLVFADKVFKNLELFRDLEAIRPILGNLLYKAKYKPKVLKHPIIRSILANKLISNTCI